MNGNDSIKPFITAISLFVIITVPLYIYLPNLVNSNLFIGFISFFVGFLVFYLYRRQRQDAKKNAAKIILQEIRRAEDIIFSYKEHGHYIFTKKIIATNSWGENIHYFVGDLSVDELDKISSLYSIGEYLDSIIAKISDVSFDKKIKEAEEHIDSIKKATSSLSLPEIQENSGQEEVFDGQERSGQQLSKRRPSSMFKIPFKIPVPAPWKDLLDEITYRYEPIYHSNICEKLRKIAKIN